MAGDWCPDEDYGVVFGDEMTWDYFIEVWAYVGWRYAWEESWRQRGFKVSHTGSGTVIRHPNAARYSDLI